MSFFLAGVRFFDWYIYFFADFEWLGKYTGDAVAGARRSLASFQYGYVLCYGRTTARCDGTGVPRKQVRILFCDKLSLLLNILKHATFFKVYNLFQMINCRSGLSSMSGNVALDAVKVIDLLAIARSAVDLASAEFFLGERVASVAEAKAAVVERALLGAHCW